MSTGQRTIELPVPDELVELCESHGTTPEVVLYGFIADLCQLEGQKDPALNNHGSNERDAVRLWFRLIPWHLYRPRGCESDSPAE
jgi:hypothetical protein